MRKQKKTGLNSIFVLGTVVFLSACFDYPEMNDDKKRESESEAYTDSDSAACTDSDSATDSDMDTFSSYADTDSDQNCVNQIDDYESCKDCLCSVEFMNCESEPDCVNLHYCLVDCDGDTTCGNECEKEHANSVDTLYTLYDCVYRNCEDYICECSEGASSCDDGRLKTCNDGCKWTINTCEDVCTRSGYDYSTGECSYSEDFEQDVCWCDNCECEKDDYRCDGNKINTCNNGCMWTTTDCEEICVKEGYDYSTGECSYSVDSGHDVCWCGYCECEKGDQLCDGDRLKTCNDGCNWTIRDCDRVCVSDGWEYSTGCSYSTEYGVELCWCS